MNGFSSIPHYDAVIVGARVAGASTAMLLARHGLRVLVVDRSEPGTDTTSTHALMRAGVLQLRRWGLLDRVWASGAAPIRKTTFHYGQRRIAVDIKDRHGVDALVAPRRHIFDGLLVDAAREAGAVVWHGVSLKRLIQDDRGRVIGLDLLDQQRGALTVSADIVIGADGVHSTVARLVGAPTIHSGAHATASLYHYVTDLPNTGYHWHYADGLGAGVIPTHHGQSCIFVSGPSARVRTEIRAGARRGFERLLARCAPDLADRVMACEPVGKTRGWGGKAGHILRSTGPGWALVGDAAYFKDPLTAHGMTDALRDAELLARAIVDGAPAAYAGYVATRNQLSHRFFALTDRVASCQWSLEELGTLHLELNREMGREERYLADLPPVPRPLASAS